MRVLLREKDDNTLTVFTASKVVYYPTVQRLRLLPVVSAAQSMFVDNVSPDDAERIIRTLYNDGKVDLAEKFTARRIK